jgi:hypothetical protein
MGVADRPDFLRIILSIDAAACLAMGLLMTAGSGLLSWMTEISAGLLISAGASLFPIGAFIAFVAARASTWLPGVWLVVVGNLGWVVGSAWLLVGGHIAPNGLGSAFVLFQAAAVALLTTLELLGLRRITASA